jgi:RNA-directed DNA polymerase
MPQKPKQLGRANGTSGEAASVVARVEAPLAKSGNERPGMQGAATGLMEKVVERPNLLAALKRVRENKGSPGVDGMTVKELPAFLKVHWPRLREELIAGRYQPQPVRRVMIPKPGGGERALGIPTVLDRFIQQALLQVLQPCFDPTFSEASYGFRPGRLAHDAVRRAQGYVQDGRRFVVDIDLEKFFDRVNHDVLMGRLAKRIADRRVLGLVRRYLDAGVLADGVVIERHEGTPQGGPLSPLLANVLLDEVDKELERRGHVRPLRGRPEHLCSVKASGRACHGGAASPLCSAEAPRQRSQERGGARHRTQVPRLLVLDRSGTEDQAARG